MFALIGSMHTPSDTIGAICVDIWGCLQSVHRVFFIAGSLTVLLGVLVTIDDVQSHPDKEC